MAFDWRDFFLHAHQLRGSSDETAQRIAIGRAYYYAYNVALISAQKRGFKGNAKPLVGPVAKPRGGVHQKLWDWYANQPGTDDQDLADFGLTLKGRRTDADYRLSPASPITSVTVQKQLDETRDFEVLLCQIDKTAPPPAI